ncbi:MAG: hypothetical protein V4693_14290 [Pseudomonadota bacterium]
MENYFQATTMAPDKKFKAVQRDGGGALLFSIDSDNRFIVTCELTGERAAWKSVALVDDATSKHYPGAVCHDFEVAQRADGSIHMALVVRESKAGAGKPTDHLYLADLTLAASGEVQPTAWTEYAYDADTPRSAPQIAGIFLSEASDGEYVIADLVRDPTSPTREIARYFIDPSRYQGQAWHRHDVPVDIEADKYASVLGRKAGAGIDGMYVAGQIDGKPQIVYTPLYNELRRDQHPLSDYLTLSASQAIVPDAIAACPNTDHTSDLYACANGVLYRFASTNQGNGAVATLATRNAQFHGVKNLFAVADGGKGVIWGRNADNAVFYTSCPRAKLDDPASWTIALPILHGVEQLSPFVNRANANALFAHTGGNDLKIGIKSPTTGAWAWRDVTLAPRDAQQPAAKFSSYTTKIQIHDADRKPANGVTVAISATAVTGVFINHVYYTAGPEPIHVLADLAGSVTIVEAVPRLTGTRFDVAVAGDSGKPMPVNPMHNAFSRAAALDSPAKLRATRIKRYVKGAGGTFKVETRDLLKPGVDDATLTHVANLNLQLATVYADPAKAPPKAMLLTATAAFAVPADAPRVDAGDLFQFLEARSDHLRLQAVRAHPAALAAGASFWDSLVRWFEGAWEFVVKIGEAVYRCVLATVEAIVSAVRWVFDKIVTGVEDLVEFLQYLFEWDDFKRTKDVIHNVSRLFMSHQVDQIPVVKKKFDDAIESAIKSINHWAGIKDYPGLGDDGSGRVSSKAKEEGPDAPGSLLLHHYQGNVHAATQASAGAVSFPGALLAAFEAAMEGEKITLDNAFHQLRDLAREAPGMSVVAILQGLTGILADAVLRSAKVVIDAVLDIFTVVARQALALLDAPVHIPVLSDILNAIGIADFSMLDVICWVAAVPATIGYKIAAALAGKEHRAPFPDNAETRLLIEANDFGVLAAAFKVEAPKLLAESRAPAAAAAGGPIPLSDHAAEAVAISLHAVSGVCGIVSAFLDASESLLPETLVPMPLSFGCVASAIVGGGSRAASNFLVPRYPLEGALDRYYSILTTGFFLLNKVVWGAAGLMGNPTARSTGAKCDAVLVIPALVITCVHFSQLAQKPAGKMRSVAIIDETSFMATYVARVLYTLVVTGVFDADEKVKAGVATTMGVFQIVHGSLQFGESAVEWLA